MMSAPSSASRMAWLRPCPRAAPVMNATLPSTRPMVSSFARWMWRPPHVMALGATRGRAPGEPAAGLQPALLLGDPRGLDAGARAGLADRQGQVVAHRPLRQEQPPGDLGHRGPVGGLAQHVGLAGGQRRGADGERGRGQFPVDDPVPRADVGDRPGQLGDRRVLDQEARGADLHGAAQEAGPAEGGEDDGADVGQRGGQRPRGLEPVHAGHLDVEQGDLRAVLSGGLHDDVAPADLGDPLQVLLEVEQRAQGAADHGLVLGDEHPDHDAATGDRAGAGRGTTARSRKPRPGAAPHSTDPPSARTRSVSPARPLPVPPVGPRPSSVTVSSMTGEAAPSSGSPSSTVTACAPLCRSTLVVASRTTQPSTASTLPGRGGTADGALSAMPAADSAERASASAWAQLTWRYPLTASRTSASARRAAASTSAISSRARAGSRSASRPASWLFSAISDRLWPSRSCRSRAKRSRSSATALRASSSRASVSWVLTDTRCRVPRSAKAVSRHITGRMSSPGSPSRLTTAVQTAAAATTAGHTHRCGSAAAEAAET